MAKKPLPSLEVLRQLLHYDPETGKLFWKDRKPEWFSGSSPESNCSVWNRKYSGKEAFTSIGSHGYKQGALFGVMTVAHRVIWAIVHDAWPVAEVDHRNGCKVDNRLVNLRAATKSENQRNKGVYSNNTSGFKGVFAHKKSGRWIAQIVVDGVSKNLGYFDTREAASEAYQDAALKWHGDFARV